MSFFRKFKWRLLKKASQVIYLHLQLKKRAIIEEFHEKQEQVKEWLQNLGIGDHTTVVHDDDEVDDETVHSHHEESAKKRYVPSRAALPIIRPTLGKQQSVLDTAKVAMQGYLNHFLGNMDIVNSREVCKFLEVSKLSFSSEYGPKLKEDYVMVKHLKNILKEDDDGKCCTCHWFSWCNNNWQKVWAVLKPGFFALLEDPFDTKLLDIIVFDVLRSSNGKKEGQVSLAKETKERNPLRYAFLVSSGAQSMKLRTKSNAKVRDWIASINDAGLKPPEGWCHPHRFGSFAPPRGLTEDGTQAQWFVDGQAAFEAIALAIEEAKSEIFITDWWLCPELYLRRPFNACDSSRLDALLEAKAKQGVKIYILLYKEVAIALKINSAYSKQKLLNIHENVRVLRYPDHISTGIYLWSHHEKLVIVDYKIGFIGGLDLCFGRYDNFEHKVGDFPPMIWPGKDYYNPRESEPNSWEDTMRDELDRCKYPRMPWHDVHCALWGPPCRDIARHFVQRWNYAKRNKAPNVQAIPLLMPQQHMVIPHYMGRRNGEIESESNNMENCHGDIKNQGSLSSPTSLQDIPLLFPREAYGLDAANENLNLNGFDKTHIPNNQPSRFSQNLSVSSRKSEAKPSVLDLQMKGFLDELNSVDHQRQVGLNAVESSGTQGLDEWWKKQERGDQLVSADEAGQVGPRTSCRCQVIRSVGQWSAGTSQTEESIHIAYCSLIDKAEHFIYIENQFFISGLSRDEIIRNRVLDSLYKRILRAYKEKKCFRVIIVMPLLPGFQGGLDDGGAASVRAIMHWQYRTICRGQNSILHNLYDVLGPKTHDYISFYSLRGYGRLCDGGPLVTNQVYVHSKVMIIDDRVALIGSANINDRSLLGSRDSEIGIVIEDKEFVDSSMNGKPWKAGKFSFSLRLSLWSEHLGLRDGEISQISDLVVDATYKDIWMATAKTNTGIYQDIFACIPNDHLHTRSEIRESMTYWKERLGHTTIDLGVAPEKIEAFQKGDIKVTDPMERSFINYDPHQNKHLPSCPGAVVCTPLHSWTVVGTSLYSLYCDSFISVEKRAQSRSASK
ncbi:Phospholipase D/Transphosphatidylase [Macleaya cordata]|uniref:Phospholipase n=1 Tax=Macleaya cordata TaxID=56857 RepID=A0A200PWM8_MACCD|nr:Phospholipase D/Transphosphatidylase [Macleaya cordata]